MSCHVCKKIEEHCENLRCCSKCKSRSYCSKECQHKHWKTGHKIECRNLQYIREGMEVHSADTVSAIGDPPPASEIDRHNARAQKFEQKVEFSFDYKVDTTKGAAWNQHVQDIMSRDPSTRTETGGVEMIVLDCAGYFLRSDENLRMFKFNSEPCLAIFQSIRSHPHGMWGFEQFCYTSAEDHIWKNGPNMGPWTCYKCQNPETRHSSMSFKFSTYNNQGQHQGQQKVKMLVFRLPVCPQCVPSASREVLSIETEVRKVCRASQLTL
jgi:hypothetical protein